MKIALSIVVSLLLIWTLKTLWDANVFENFHDFHVETCHPIAEIQGPEDIVQLDSDTLLISSSYYEPYYSHQSGKGALYLFNTQSRLLKNLTASLDFDFYPHGIDVFEGKIVFAVNHQKTGDRIEKFELNGEELKHIASYENESLHHANDIAAVDGEHFFVSIDHGARTKLGQLIENFSQYGQGAILFHDGVKFHSVLEGFSFTNGLSIDRKAKRLYVSEMIAKRVNIYDYSEFLKPRKIDEIKTIGFPDNIDLKNDELWIAQHLQILKLKKHSESPFDNNSPSLVTKYSLNEKKSEDVLIGTESLLSGVSVAIAVVNEVYLGNIYRKELIKCLIE